MRVLWAVNEAPAEAANLVAGSAEHVEAFEVYLVASHKRHVEFGAPTVDSVTEFRVPNADHGHVVGEYGVGVSII